MKNKWWNAKASTQPLLLSRAARGSRTTQDTGDVGQCTPYVLGGWRAGYVRNGKSGEDSGVTLERCGANPALIDHDPSGGGGETDTSQSPGWLYHRHSRCCRFKGLSTGL